MRPPVKSVATARLLFQNVHFLSHQRVVMISSPTRSKTRHQACHLRRAMCQPALQSILTSAGMVFVSSLSSFVPYHRRPSTISNAAVRSRSMQQITYKCRVEMVHALQVQISAYLCTPAALIHLAKCDVAMEPAVRKRTAHNSMNRVHLQPITDVLVAFVRRVKITVSHP